MFVVIALGLHGHDWGPSQPEAHGHDPSVRSVDTRAQAGPRLSVVRPKRSHELTPRRLWPWTTILFVFIVSGCASGSPGTTPTTTSRLASLSSVVALGDSVPYGTKCHCSPYPNQLATLASKIVGHDVVIANDSVPGYVTTDVLDQLEHDSDVRDQVQHAAAVMVEVGANDIAYSSTCETNVACYESKLPQVTANLNEIVTQIRQLADRPHVPVILLDYWSVWLGGKYAEDRGTAYVDAADSLTHTFNDAVQAVASKTGSRFVDIRVAFRGPDDSYDETNLLANDGEHPNAAGHQRIAKAIEHALSAH